MSAERTPRSRRFRRAILAVPAAALIAASLPTACACPDGTCTTVSDTRLLDRVCKEPLDGRPACEATGASSVSEGITADSRGFRLEPTGAALIHLGAVDGLRIDGDYDVEILAAADAEDGAGLVSELTWGSCGDCPQDPPSFTVRIPHEPAWVKIQINQPQIGPTAVVPYDAVLTLRGGKGIDIVDMRVIAMEPLLGGCN